MAILTLILPFERDNCGSFRRILLKFGIHDGIDQPLDKFKNDHYKIQNGRLIVHFDFNLTWLESKHTSASGYSRVFSCFNLLLV